MCVCVVHSLAKLCEFMCACMCTLDSNVWCKLVIVCLYLSFICVLFILVCLCLFCFECVVFMLMNVGVSCLPYPTLFMSS